MEGDVRCTDIAVHASARRARSKKAVELSVTDLWDDFESAHLEQTPWKTLEFPLRAGASCTS